MATNGKVPRSFEHNAFYQLSDKLKEHHMKTFTIKRLSWYVLLCACCAAALIGCGTTPDEAITYRNVIPDSLKIAAADKLELLMKAATTQSRVDDEDWDDFIRAANEVVISQYGVPTPGIANKQNWKMFVPYNLCSPAQRRWIDEYLAKER
jgi:hypothetical protein